MCGSGAEKASPRRKRDRSLTRSPRCAKSVPRQAETVRHSVDTVDMSEPLTWAFEDPTAPRETRWTGWPGFTHQRSAVRYRPRPPMFMQVSVIPRNACRRCSHPALRRLRSPECGYENRSARLTNVPKAANSGTSAPTRRSYGISAVLADDGSRIEGMTAVAGSRD